MKKSTIDFPIKLGVIFFVLILGLSPILFIEANGYYQTLELIEIEDENIPLSPGPSLTAGQGSSEWLNINLFFTLITTVLALATLSCCFKKPAEERTNTIILSIVASSLLVSGSAILFTYTSTINQPMPVFDSWSVWMGLLTALQFAIFVYTAKNSLNTITVERKPNNI